MSTPPEPDPNLVVVHTRTERLVGKNAARHVTEEEVLQTYSLQLIGPPQHPTLGHFIGKRLMRETEENLTDLLAPGYKVRIREWDAEEETPNE